MAKIDLHRRVFLVRRATSTGVHSIGTAFGIERPGLILTARHVVEACIDRGKPTCAFAARPTVRCCTRKSITLSLIPKPISRLWFEGMREANLRLCCTAYRPLLHTKVDHIVPHPQADIAALVVEPDDRLDHFDIGTPKKGFAEFPLGESVSSFGYPSLEKPVQPRLMKGHIQRQFRHRKDGYDYRAFELAFPAFPGQSGSPVFDDFNRNAVMGLVTALTSYVWTEKGASQPTTAGFWAIGASITPLADWVRSID